MIDTEPAAGKRVLPGDKIVLVVSSGKERFAVPGVGETPLAVWKESGDVYRETTQNSYINN